MILFNAQIQFKYYLSDNANEQKLGLISDTRIQIQKKKKNSAKQELCVAASLGMKNLTINTGAAQWPWYNVYRTTIYSCEYISNYIEFTCNYAWCNRNEFHI